MNRGQVRMVRLAQSNNESGFLLIEVVMAVLLMSVVIVGLVGAGILSGTQLRMSRTDLRVYEAAQQQMEELVATGFAAVMPGTAVKNGLDLKWTVAGTDPKKIILIVQRPNSRGTMVPDTFVNYLTDWGT